MGGVCWGTGSDRAASAGGAAGPLRLCIQICLLHEASSLCLYLAGSNDVSHFVAMQGKEEGVQREGLFSLVQVMGRKEGGSEGKNEGERNK